MTSLQCDRCHSNTRWTPIVLRHSSPNYPGDHRARLVCTSCHRGNAQTVTWPTPAYQPDCAGCHARNFKPGPHTRHKNPDTRYTVSELRDCSGSCHVYSDSSMSTVVKRRNGEHRVSDGGFD